MAARAPARIVVASPPRTKVVYRRKPRAYQRARRAALQLPPTATAVIGAAILAHVQSKEIVTWQLGNMGVPASLGLVAWLAGKYTGIPALKHAATGMLSVAAYQWAQSRGGILGADFDVNE